MTVLFLLNVCILKKVQNANLAPPYVVHPHFSSWSWFAWHLPKEAEALDLISRAKAARVQKRKEGAGCRTELQAR